MGNARVGQQGYILLGVLFLVFMVMIALSIAVPKMAASIERDREVELQHRARQYRRAIKMYYKKFGAYPPTLDALEKQNEVRFLRRRYKDPVTGKADWKTIQFGQNKMPTVWGFFGQPMAGSSMAGIGPGASTGSGNLFGNSASTFGSNSGSTFGSSGANTFGSSGSSAFGSSGSSGIGGSSFGSSIGSSNGSSPNGSSSGSNNGTSSNGTSNGSTDSSGNSSGSSGSSGDSSNGSGSSSGSGSGSSFGGSGQTFGGAGIIGVESVSAKKAILEYHKKQHFNEWEFVYDPMQDQMMLSNNTNIGTPASGLNSNGVATPGSISTQPGSSQFGNSGQFGSTPNTQTTPTQPTTSSPQ